MASTSRNPPSRSRVRKTAPAAASRSAPELVSASIVNCAAQRAGWVLAPGRAEQIAASALPVVNLFEGVNRIIDFDSDPLDFQVVREAVKYRDGA